MHLQIKTSNYFRQICDINQINSNHGLICGHHDSGYWSVGIVREHPDGVFRAIYGMSLMEFVEPRVNDWVRCLAGVAYGYYVMTHVACISAGFLCYLIDY